MYYQQRISLWWRLILTAAILLSTRFQIHIQPPTLASIKSMLPSGSFYQSHRCYIVNMNYIMSYNNSRIYMENHLYADIALRKYNDFFNTYSAFLTTLRQFINQRGIYEFNIVLFICISYRSHYSMAILQPDIYFTKEHIFISFNHYWHVQSAYTCSNSH